MTIALQEKDPGIKPEFLLEPHPSDFEMEGVRLRAYEFPEHEGDTINKVAVDNPEGLADVINKGLDGLEDGQVVTFTKVKTYAYNNSVQPSGGLRRLGRDGDLLTWKKIDSWEITPVESEEAEPSALAVANKEHVKEFFESANTDFCDPSLGLSNRQDKLGGLVRELGFGPEGDTFPRPSVLKERLGDLREHGVQVPDIAYFSDTVISPEDYVGAWAEGSFPASDQLGWFAHDVLSDHFRSLLIFREGAMGIAHLYAKSVEEMDTIVGRDYPDNYEINKLEPQKIEITLSGHEKIGHAAGRLDQYTARLDNVVRSLDEDPVSADLSENHMDVFTEMTAVILKSSHREELLDYLKSVGSEAYDSETDTISHETYMRELLGGAQEYWGITPQPEQAPDQPAQIIDDQRRIF